MINKILLSSNFSSNKVSQSFGLARLNEIGRQSADSFEMHQNTFLDSNMFKKESFLFGRPAIIAKLKAGDSFSDICKDYGCSRNAKSNAQFIKAQIINNSANNQFHKYIDEETISAGILSLYEHNYDNPELSLKDTKKLLDLASASMSTPEYVQNVGLLDAGTK